MNTSSNQLGRLERVTVREVWADEAQDFTPWLAEEKNIALLGETIGMRLEVEAQERSVGPFRADILCKNLTDSSWVLVENQLERTDHTHLGQLITYAAGLNAVSIVWIAQRFTEEHRAALDWLNDKTPEDICFFGLEVELWRIGNSSVAPKFNIISKPNEWKRTTIRGSSADPERAALCHEYWSGVLAALEPSEILTREAKPYRKQDMLYPVGWKNFWLKSYFSTAANQIGVWIQCRGQDGSANFREIQTNKETINEAFGETLDWIPGEDVNRGYFIMIYENVDPTDRNDWERQHSFLAEKITSLYRALEPHVAVLDAKDIEGTL